MIIKALLEGSLNGVGKHHLTPIFPCGIFQLMKGVNRMPGDPNYDLYRLALKSTAQRLYPNYANCDCLIQKSWEESDIKIRQKTLDNLSDEQKELLAKKIQEDPSIGELLGIEVQL